MIKQMGLALLLAVLSVSSLVAQIRNGPAPETSIRGKVFLSTGQGADRIEVRLERAEMQVLSSVYTDGIGNFEFRNVTNGVYYLVVKAEGYEEVRQAVDMSIAGRGGATVTITLNKPA